MVTLAGLILLFTVGGVVFALDRTPSVRVSGHLRVAPSASWSGRDTCSWSPSSAIPTDNSHISAVACAIGTFCTGIGGGSHPPRRMADYRIMQRETKNQKGGKMFVFRPQ